MPNDFINFAGCSSPGTYVITSYYQLLAATTGYYRVMAANWSICTSSDAYGIVRD